MPHIHFPTHIPITGPARFAEASQLNAWCAAKGLVRIFDHDRRLYEIYDLRSLSYIFYRERRIDLQNHVGRNALNTIHYYRVSTAQQGRSGLGLEAQSHAIETFCATRSCAMLAEYTEIESGKRNDRPELTKALHHAKVTGATLVIAKLDRLSRNAAFPHDAQGCRREVCRGRYARRERPHNRDHGLDRSTRA